MEKLPIFIFIKDLNLWGHKYVIEKYHEKYDVHLIAFALKNNKNYVDILDSGVIVHSFKSKRILTTIELFLRGFIIPPKTTNYKNSIRKQLAVPGNRLRRLYNYLTYLIKPKIFTSTSIFRFLGIFRNEIDILLDLHKPIFILYFSMFLPNYYPISRSKKLGYQVYVIIYSWDNPYRDVTLPQHLDKYYVWNKEMAQDLLRIHGISLNKVIISGPYQFSYLKLNNSKIDFVWREEDKELIDFIDSNKEKYFLFAFSAALSAMSQEIKLVEHIAKLLHFVAPEIFLLCRPYPNNWGDTEKYYLLERFSNIKVQRILGNSFNQNIQELVLKRLIMQNCIAVINIGTTMCLEAALLNKAIIQISYLPKEIVFSQNFFERFADLDKLIENEHLTRYLNKKEYINVINSDNDFKICVKKILNNDEEIMKYTDYLKGIGNANELEYI